MSTRKSIEAPGPSEVIQEALKQTKQVADEIKVTADELGVVHAVLDKNLAKSPDTDVGQAIARTQELEERLMESVETLEAANALLADQALSKAADR